jgi:hypothetical protein
MTSAFTASVWGQGRAAVALSASIASTLQVNGAVPLDECHICRDDIPVAIAFVPCSHKVCFGCVENMRAKNVFKVRVMPLLQPGSCAGLAHACMDM